MIQVDGLTIAYHGHPLFEDASFTIQEKERCGFVGRNGSGKSTLFRLLSDKEGADAGSIAFRKNYRIGLLDQHIRFTQPTLLEEAALGLRPEECDCLYKVEAILFGLGFNKEDLDRSLSDFSGGYQLRVHLAKVLVSEPDCLLLDEPTNYLDIVSIRWFARFLQLWRGELILITHDREFMDSVTTHTMGIHRQKIRKVKGGTVQFYEQLLQEEEVHERTRQNLEKKKAHAQSFIDRFGAKATKAGQAQSRQKMIQRIPVLEKLKNLEQLAFNFNEAPFYGKKMLDAEGVSFSYDKQTFLINELSLEVGKGEKIAIVGKNGRGKSTILKLLGDDLSPDAGVIKRSEAVCVGYFGQTNIDRLHPHHTVEQEIATANPLLTVTQVKGICGLMMFSGDKASKRTEVLSGGERSRVLLGKIIAAPCNLLLLDEPTHHLDIESVEALVDALEEFEGAVVLVTHSELILKRMALDKIVVCHEGRQQVFLGGYEEFLEKDGWHDHAEAMKPVKKAAVKSSMQQKADSSEARTKVLKPIDKAIAKAEEAITHLEIEQEALHHHLIEASEKGDALAIQEITRQCAEKKQKIEDSFAVLEKLLSRRDEVLGS